MIRSKLGLVGLCVVMLGTMMSASPAQATLSWLVLDLKQENPKELKAVLLGRSDSTDLTLLTKVIGMKVAITCTSVGLAGVNLEAGGKLTEGGKIWFTGCEAYGAGALGEPLGCKVHSAGWGTGTVESTEGKGELVLHQFFDEALIGKVIVKVELTEVLAKFEPKVSGGALATVLTEGCVLPESNPIKGKVFFKDGEGQATTHLFEHLVEPGPLTSLYIGSHTAEHLETSLDGSGWVSLFGEHINRRFGAMDA